MSELPTASELQRHDVRLADGELVLRPLTEDDWDVVAVWALDPEVLFFSELSTVDERSRSELQTALRTLSRVGCCFVIEAAGEPVGDGRLRPMDLERVLDARPDDTMWRLEVLLAREAWGRQLGRRAARLLCAHAFESLSADSVWAELGDHNPRALRMLYHLGFKDAAMRHEPPGRKAFRTYDLVLERSRWEARR